jgi:hypothetical protein
VPVNSATVFDQEPISIKLVKLYADEPDTMNQTSELTDRSWRAFDFILANHELPLKVALSEFVTQKKFSSRSDAI